MPLPTKTPKKIGVMILPETVLFPGGLLPLFIFEPRYRIMLAEALESHRMFAIGLMRSSEEEVFPVGCAGFVRACVTNPDGTSHLMLQGVERVQFSEWLDGDFPHAGVEVLRSVSPPAHLEESLRGEIRNLCSRLSGDQAEIREQIETLLEKTPGLAEFSDLAASTIVNDTAIRQRLLEEQDVTNRVAILAAFLVRIVCPD